LRDSWSGDAGGWRRRCCSRNTSRSSRNRGCADRARHRPKPLRARPCNRPGLCRGRIRRRWGRWCGGGPALPADRDDTTTWLTPALAGRAIHCARSTLFRGRVEWQPLAQCAPFSSPWVGPCSSGMEIDPPLHSAIAISRACPPASGPVIAGTREMAARSRAGEVTSVVLVVEQDPIGRAFRIVELAMAQRPEERGKPGEAEAERNRYQEQQAAHLTALASRNDWATTTSDLADVAAAAISGVSRPATASGTANTL